MVRATRYFSPIDHDKTIENAKEVLRNYWHHKRLAQRTKTALRSPVMDGMPKSPSYGNKAEDKLVSHADEVSGRCQINQFKNSDRVMAHQSIVSGRCQINQFKNYLL